MPCNTFLKCCNFLRKKKTLEIIAGKKTVVSGCIKLALAHKKKTNVEKYIRMDVKESVANNKSYCQTCMPQDVKMANLF